MIYRRLLLIILTVVLYIVIDSIIAGTFINWNRDTAMDLYRDYNYLLPTAKFFSVASIVQILKGIF